MKNYVEHIHTPRLTLRMLEVTDAEVIQDLLARNKEHMIPWVPWAIHEPEPVEEKKQKIRTWKGEFFMDQKYVYGAFNTESGVLIGLVFLFTRQGKDILEIGYIIDHLASGKGYATECSYALTKLGFQHIAVQKMMIICSGRNEASARIPEKLGYHLEARQLSVERNELGDREENLIWSLFKENVQQDEKYEPTNFILGKGW